MPRAINRLSTDRAIKAMTKPGMHADGQGLYLRITKAGSKQWVFVYQCPIAGKRRDMGLGGYPKVGLALARTKAAAAREDLAHGRDPMAEPEAPAAPTIFGPWALACVDEWEAGWKNAKHKQQWRNQLTTYCKPIWDREVGSITTEDVLAILKPIWLEKNETADRVRMRIERVLNAARALGKISPPYENPARWRGHLAHLLPLAAEYSRGHFTALPYPEMPAFMAALRAREGGHAVKALEFTILTWARSGMTRTMQEMDIDREAKEWRVPGHKMKGGKPHVVPLSDRMLELIGPARADPETYIFAAPDGKPLSDGGMERVLDRMGCNATVHGFRSTAKDWASNCTEYADELSEEALAHQVGSKVRRAYRRGQALERRGPLMRDWEAFCAGRLPLKKAA